MAAEASAPSDAASSVDGFGDGHSGSKHVTAKEIVNAYAALAGNAGAKATSIDIDLVGPIVVGDLLTQDGVVEPPTP